MPPESIPQLSRPATPERMRPVYWATWKLTRLLAGNFFRWRVLHVERIPRTGPVILAANHTSFADPPLVGCAVPRVIHFLARHTLFDIPVVGAWMRALNSVPVDRNVGGAGLKAILDRLQDGGGILLFPEGTRSPDGLIQKAQAGVGLTIIKSTAPVVPVRLFGVFDAWGRQRKLPRPLPVVLKFGHPLDFARLRAESRSCAKPRLREIYQEASDTIMHAINYLEPCVDITQFPP